MESDDLDPPRVLDKSWQRRLILFDGILIAVLAWLLWSISRGGAVPDENVVERPAEIESLGSDSDVDSDPADTEVEPESEIKSESPK